MSGKSKDDSDRRERFVAKVASKKVKKVEIEHPEYKFSVELNPVPMEEEPMSSYVAERLKANPDYVAPGIYLAAQDIQRVLGFLPPLDASLTDTGETYHRYVPLREKKAILQRSNANKRDKLMHKWGVTDRRELLHDARYHQMLLQHGRASVALVLPVMPFTDENRQAARRALCYDPDQAVLKPANEKSAAEVRTERIAEYAEKADAKQLRQERKAAVKRKEALERVTDARRKERLERIQAAVPGYGSTVAASTEVAGASQGVIIGGTQGVIGGVKKEVVKKRTIAELREQLAKVKERKLELTRLEKEGDFEELKRRKDEEGWAEARNRLEGKKVENQATVARSLRQAVEKKKNSGKKLQDKLAAQDQAKHKSHTKKMSNVRDKRVARQATKVIRLQKGGRVLPGYH